MINRYWVNLAVSNVRESLSKRFISNNWHFATDEYRMHIGRMDKIPEKEKTNGVGIGEKIKILDELETEFEIPINPQFLIEALKGFEDESQVIFEILNNAETVKISGINGDKRAYIMAMHKLGDSEND